MGIGTSLLLIAVGAILRYAVTASTSGFSIHTAGLILMILGAVGLVVEPDLTAGYWRREPPYPTDRRPY